MRLEDFLRGSRWRGAIIRLIAIFFLLAGGVAMALGYTEAGRQLLVIGIGGGLAALVLHLLFRLGYFLSAGRTDPDD